MIIGRRGLLIACRIGGKSGRQSIVSVDVAIPETLPSIFQAVLGYLELLDAHISYCSFQNALQCRSKCN